MATLSSFFGSSGGGGAAGVASTFRVFYETGSMTVPSCAVFAAYGVIGGGGAFANVCANCCCCRKSGGGGGFSWKEAAQSCASNFTVCAIVGAAACRCATTSGCACGCYCLCNGGLAGTSCICGFSGGTICATGGGQSNCGCNAGMGSGGDINSCGGRGGYWSYYLGGGGAGGLYGKGGDVHQGAGGGGFGSGGGAGGGGTQGIETISCDVTNVTQGDACHPPIFTACGGAGGGQRGAMINGGSGLSGTGGMTGVFSTCHASPSGGMFSNEPTGGLIPQYTMCGYSQAKTFLSASGGGGASIDLYNANTNKGGHSAQGGAPGGGGGGVKACHPQNGQVAGNGGFGAGGGSNHCDCFQNGTSGIGAGAPSSNAPSDRWVAGQAGQGIAVVEYWVTTS